MRKLLATAAMLLFSTAPADAQQLLEPEYGEGFSVSVSTTSADAAFTGSGGTIKVYNAHDQVVWIKTGVQTGETPELVATAEDDWAIPPDREHVLRRPRTHTHIAVVAASGTGTVYVNQGSGN